MTNECSKILYRYIDKDGNKIAVHVGLLGNWSIIPAGAVSVQVVSRPEDLK